MDEHGASVEPYRRGNFAEATPDVAGLSRGTGLDEKTVCLHGSIGPVIIRPQSTAEARDRNLVQRRADRL